MLRSSGKPYPSLFPPRLSQDQASKDKALQSMAALSSAQIVSASVMKSQLTHMPQPPYAPPARVIRLRSPPSQHIEFCVVCNIGYTVCIDQLETFICK